MGCQIQYNEPVGNLFIEFEMLARCFKRDFQELRVIRGSLGTTVAMVRVEDFEAAMA